MHHKAFAACSSQCCLMQVGLDKVAAYRDEDGTLKTFSAVCPHLKCSVMYNPKDNTFDCACHGSHFDTNGECIQGEPCSLAVIVSLLPTCIHVWSMLGMSGMILIAFFAVCRPSKEWTLSVE